MKKCYSLTPVDHRLRVEQRTTIVKQQRRLQRTTTVGWIDRAKRLQSPEATVLWQIACLAWWSGIDRGILVYERHLLRGANCRYCAQEPVQLPLDLHAFGNQGLDAICYRTHCLRTRCRRQSSLKRLLDKNRITAVDLHELSQIYLSNKGQTMASLAALSSNQRWPFPRSALCRKYITADPPISDLHR